jgi:hypothetical protein
MLLGLLALAAGGLALARSVWLGDVYEGLVVAQTTPSQPEERNADVVLEMPGIVKPVAVSADDADLMYDTPVLGVSAGGRSRAYLVEALATGPGSHIVNDVLGGIPISVTYCDLSRCNRAFTDDGERKRLGQPLDLSGGGIRNYRLVLKSGGHAYDQETSRPLDPGSPPFPYREYHVERTSWQAWQKAHPESDVYLGTIPAGSTINSARARETTKQKSGAEVRVPSAEMGLVSIPWWLSALLLLTGIVILLPLLPRRVFRVAIVVLLLGGAALVIPGSPVSLAVLLEASGGYHDGHRTRYWLRALSSPDEEVRHKAIFALGIIGPDRPEVVPALAGIVVDDADAESRHQAALALMKIGPAARTAVPELAQALADDEPAVRMCAALALGRLGAEARPAVPALIVAVQRADNRTNLGTFLHTIRESAAIALSRASAGSAEGVPVLTGALKAARSIQARECLARALGNIGAAARSAAPELRALLSNKVPAVREAAAEALRKIER